MRMNILSWFKKKELPGNTGIKVTVGCVAGGKELVDVYDTGNGAFVYNTNGDIPIYLLSNGLTMLECLAYRGDATEWVIAEGNKDDLNYFTR